MPAVVVLPDHFARNAEATGAVAVVPEDGPIGVAAYLALRRDASAEARRVVDYLRSEAWLRPLWEHGAFQPDLADLGAELPGGRILTRPWTSVLEEGAEARSDHLIRLVRGGGL